ncbi:hypothetical protein C8R46DRAFT_282281 [Mycena filopes]|nr:hypothetical protein C8R46DRAFT_282281 [Mycena filopes]
MVAPRPFLSYHFWRPRPLALLASTGHDDPAAALLACVVKGHPFFLFAVSWSASLEVAFRDSKWIQGFWFTFAFVFVPLHFPVFFPLRTFRFPAHPY